MPVPVAVLVPVPVPDEIMGARVGARHAPSVAATAGGARHPSLEPGSGCWLDHHHSEISEPSRATR
ncbi:MAG TPA: hypothetical protein VLT32_06675, partial [Candidatus Sulfomarinibacteraceae bacterium]|nr:hypothetical protein [Candidatus Sulfomarinibacteraceae bacterium]